MLDFLDEYFRERRTVIFAATLITLLAGVVSGIICSVKEVLDFGTAFLSAAAIGAALIILVLGCKRFAPVFSAVFNFGLPSDFDSNYKSIDILILPRLVVLGAILAIAVMVECVLLPVDIIGSVILLIMDIAGGVKSVDGDTRKTKDNVKKSVSAETEIKHDILGLAELTDDEIKMLCKEAEKVADNQFKCFGKKKVTYRYLGNIILTKSGKNFRIYFVYKVSYIVKRMHNDTVFAVYFENVCRKKDGTICFNDSSSPTVDAYWDIALREKGKIIIGVFPSLEELCARLPAEYERDSNFMDL